MHDIDKHIMILAQGDSWNYALGGRSVSWKDGWMFFEEAGLDNDGSAVVTTREERRRGRELCTMPTAGELSKPRPKKYTTNQRLHHWKQKRERREGGPLLFHHQVVPPSFFPLLTILLLNPSPPFLHLFLQG